MRGKKSHLETVSAFFRCLALRRIPHDAKYRILGRAYVDGLMDGEVFDLRDFEKHGYETVTICMVFFSVLLIASQRCSYNSCYSAFSSLFRSPAFCRQRDPITVRNQLLLKAHSLDFHSGTLHNEPA